MQAEDGIRDGHVTGVQTCALPILDDLGYSTKTLSNPADPNLPQGTYLYFSGEGDRSLTVDYGRYTTVTDEVTVPANDIVSGVDFSLPAPKFSVTPEAITVNVKAGDSATASIALANVGNGEGAFTIYPINAPPPPTGAAAVPVRHVKLKHPAWASKSMAWIMQHDPSMGGMRATSRRLIRPA